ncbi:centrosomal protein of 85 kDa [Aplysia californica]|uniref:Centrosomal protein of 85 kDa n=1 Tax=Aplysia californica TaxID=6500 RepID=A0ABM0JY21_APLCA|nr:centrosomal protein of 85 kDa [Aplysia californica]
MDDTGELTNVPDYQKIRQTSQVSGGPGTAGEHHPDWNEDVETLTPSPVVRPPSSSASTSRSMPQQHYANYALGAWPGKQGSSTSLATSKASWEAQPQPAYNPSRYGLLAASHSMSSIKEDTSFLPQGFSQPVSKYLDTNGVERRVIRRNVSPNRKSYTEGFLLRDSPEYSSYPEGRLIKSASQRNVNHDYSAPTRGDSGFVGDGHSERSPRQNFAKSLGGGGSGVGGGYQSSHGGQPGVSPKAEQWKEIGGGHLAGKNPQEDLRHWQQQHQEELLHQHLETQALYESPGPPPHHQHSVNTSFGKMMVQEEPPARWEPVRRAADNIIREKNMIIDKLKNRILELEEDFRVSESKLRQSLISKEDDADVVKQKLQEMQHKNANLKEQLNEERAKKNSEIDDLELKLGSAEHEVQQLKDVLWNKDLGSSDLRAQLEDKTREAEAWRAKFDESRSNHQDMKKKLDSLQLYLDELPTVEESRVQAQQMMSLREDNFGQKSRLEGQEKKLAQLRKVVTARDFRIRELEDNEKDLETKLNETQDELERLRDSGGSEFYNTQRELKAAKADKERLAIDLEKAKKLLETTHQRLRQVEIKYQAELRAAEERVVQEEEAVVSLRAEIASKEEQAENMKKSIKELGVRNQELLEQSLLVREQVRHMEASSTDSTVALQRRFMLQLSLCFSELQALVQVCSQRAQGQDPDISVLLGVHKTEADDDGAAGAGGRDANETMTQWLSRLGELRREVDKLRAHICNKYAEDMGDNINCATQ